MSATRYVVFVDDNVTLDTATLGLGLLVDGTEEPAPETKASYSSVPGSDGSVDLSRALTGEMTYERRSVKLALRGTFATLSAAMQSYGSVVSAVHGREMSVSTPATRLIGGAYYGECAVTGHSYSGISLDVEVSVDADPFVLVGSGSANLAHGTPTVASGYHVPVSDAACTVLEASYPAFGRMSYPATRGYLCSSGENMFDAAPHACKLVTCAAATPTAWTASSVMSKSGRRFYTGACASAWKERISIAASPTTLCGDYPNNWPASFPMVGGLLWVTAWVTGTVTSLAASVPTGESQGIRLQCLDGNGTVGSDGMPRGAVSSAKLLKVTAGQVLTDEPITLAWSRNLNCIILDFSWIESDGFAATFSITDSAPTAWTEPSVTLSPFVLPGTLQRSETTSDSMSLTMLGSTLSKETAQTADARVCVAASASTEAFTALAWPADGRRASVMLVGPQGVPMMALETKSTTYPRISTTVANSDMRSTPSITCADQTVVSIGGKAVANPAGTNVLMPFTLARGSNVVEHAVLGSHDAVMTWDEGVL